MPQFESPLGLWNYSNLGMSEHNPGFDAMFHQLMALGNWRMGSKSVYNEDTEEYIECGSALDAMIIVLNRDGGYEYKHHVCGDLG